MKSAKRNTKRVIASIAKQSSKYLVGCFGRSSLAMTILVLVQFFSTITVAQNIPARPNPPRLVNDFANILSEGERESLERKLVAYSDSTTTQIVIVTIESLEGAPVEDYAATLGEKWGVGTKENHNGVVILIAMQDRDGYIATGYGVEDGLNTNVCAQIYQNIIVPNLRSGNYYSAFDEATNAIFDALAGKYETKYSKPQSNEDRLPVGAIVFIIILLIIIIFIANRNNGDGGFISRGGYFPMGGGFGDGGSWGGGSSGGGFGGFGGGSFSGGGSGGKW